MSAMLLVNTLKLGGPPSAFPDWAHFPAAIWVIFPVGMCLLGIRGGVRVWTEQAEGAFSKRYLKYLAKKFLKKMQMRDFLRVVSTNKGTYELKYFNIQENDEDAGDE